MGPVGAFSKTYDAICCCIQSSFHRSQYLYDSLIPLVVQLRFHFKITASSAYKRRDIFMPFAVTPAPVFCILHFYVISIDSKKIRR